MHMSVSELKCLSLFFSLAFTISAAHVALFLSSSPLCYFQGHREREREREERCETHSSTARRHAVSFSPSSSLPLSLSGPLSLNESQTHRKRGRALTSLTLLLITVCFTLAKTGQFYERSGPRLSSRGCCWSFNLPSFVLPSCHVHVTHFLSLLREDIFSISPCITQGDSCE